MRDQQNLHKEVTELKATIRELQKDKEQLLLVINNLQKVVDLMRVELGESKNDSSRLLFND